MTENISTVEPHQVLALQAQVAELQRQLRDAQRTVYESNLAYAEVIQSELERRVEAEFDALELRVTLLAVLNTLARANAGEALPEAVQTVINVAGRRLVSNRAGRQSYIAVLDANIALRQTLQVLEAHAVFSSVRTQVHAAIQEIKASNLLPRPMQKTT